MEDHLQRHVERRYQIWHFLLSLLILALPPATLSWFAKVYMSTSHFDSGVIAVPVALVLASVPFVVSQVIFYRHVLPSKKPLPLFILNVLCVILLYAVLGYLTLMVVGMLFWYL